MAVHRKCSGFTLLELLVVLATLGVLVALSLAGIQRVRASAARTACGDKLRQIGVALHQYHSIHQSFPPGTAHPSLGMYGPATDPYPLLNWQGRILPFIEQDALWGEVRQAYMEDPALRLIPRVALVKIPFYVCPADPQSSGSMSATSPGLSSYLGVSGTNYYNQDGLLHMDSYRRFADILDGSSNTLLVGERPMPPNARCGRWFGGWGMWFVADGFLGVEELFTGGVSGCFSPPYPYTSDRSDNPCSVYHFWSMHLGGADFLFADGSLHFVPYSSAALLPALATRAGGEAVEPSF